LALQPEVAMQTVRPRDHQEIATDQQRRQLFLRYVNRGWLAIGLVSLVTLPLFPAQRNEFIYVAAIVFPTYLLIRFLNLSGRTRPAGIVLVLTVNFGFYGLFLFIARNIGGARAFETQATVWQLMGLAVLLAGALVGKWAAPGMALLDTLLLIVTRLALAPDSDPRPSIAVFWWMLAVVIWLYEGTLQQTLTQAWAEVAARNQAEEALRETSRTLQTVIQASPVAIITFDPEGIVKAWHPVAEQVFGWSEAEIVGKLAPHIPPGYLAEFHDLRQRVIQGEVLVNLELRRARKDGTPIDIILNTAPLYDSLGKLDGYMAVIADITARKQAETQRGAALHALRSSEERLRTVVDNLPDTIMQVNREGRIQFISRPVPGLTREQVIGSSVFQWVPAEQYPILTRTLEVVFDAGERHEYESLGPGPYGEPHSYHVRVAPVTLNGQTDSAIYIATDITERKRAEEALRESEEKFRAMIEQASEGFALIDEHGNILEWNRAIERIWGLRREEVLGRPFYDVQFQVVIPERRTPERYEALKTMTLAALRTGESPLFNRLTEGELLRPDGQRVVIQQSIFLIKSSAGYRIGSMSLDITARKQADAALKASEQKMRAIVDAAPFGAHSYELEPGGRLVFVGANPAADKILHVDHRQFIGKTIEAAFPPLITTEVPAAYRRVAASGEQFQMDQVAYDAAGISGAFELHAFQTGTNQMTVFFRDVTERKQMEDALRISLEKYRVLFESFPLGISITDSTGKIVETNRQAEKLLGVPKAEHERRAYYAPEWNIVRSNGTPMPGEEYAAARALLENRLIQNVEMGFVIAPGVIRWLSVTAAPIPLKGYGVAIAYGDVTRQKEIEDELRRLNEDLELRVVERTRELAAANARLTELDQLKSKFVSDVSHELRTPIANLKLYIDLLDRGKPEKQAQYIEVLHQQVRRVADLVDDILDLSRLEQRKEQGVIYRAVALNDVVEQVVLAHQPRAEADGLSLTFEPAAQLPPVRADANQLAQVVTNLIANALSYTSTGFVRVSTFAENAAICLCVADSGSGIAPEDLPHVFERFYRGQHVLKNDVPGTGLGLAIVKEIIDLHEGRIEVDSQPGYGTTFRVWLPLA
jgi:PAS domain S-box-containing protein